MPDLCMLLDKIVIIKNARGIRQLGQNAIGQSHLEATEDAVLSLCARRSKPQRGGTPDVSISEQLPVSLRCTVTHFLQQSTQS